MAETVAGIVAAAAESAANQSLPCLQSEYTSAPIYEHHIPVENIDDIAGTEPNVGPPLVK